jgi:hypothetical protein
MNDPAMNDLVRSVDLDQLVGTLDRWAQKIEPGSKEPATRDEIRRLCITLKEGFELVFQHIGGAKGSPHRDASRG